MYFPVSGVEVALWIPPLVAFVISFFTSMGGLSGAFVLLPFQMSLLGYTAPSVSATNQVFNMAAIPSGVYRYIRERRMVWPLAYATVIGTLPGVVVGVWIRVLYLPDPKNFKFFVGCVLLYIGARLVTDAARRGKHDKKSGSGRGEGSPGLSRVEACSRFSFRRMEYDFAGCTYCFSPLGIMVLCLAVGVVGGIYGIGGGAIVAPFLVAVWKLPVYTVAGATLLSTFTTSVVAVMAYHVMSALYPEIQIAPDWALGLLFGAGGFLGIYLGARCQRFVPARMIKYILSACLLFISLRYIIGFFS